VIILCSSHSLERTEFLKTKEDVVAISANVTSLGDRQSLGVVNACRPHLFVLQFV
jgi:hypothetical protein